MKKMRKNVGIIVMMMMLVLFTVGCDGVGPGGTGGPGGPGNQGVNNEAPPTSGKLTITGLGTYNGSYIIVRGGEVMLFAGGGIDTSEDFTYIGTQISNGTAVLDVWKIVNVNSAGFELESYDGNDQNAVFNVLILSGSTYPPRSNEAANALLNSVNFSNGIATAAISNIMPIAIVNLGNGIEGHMDARHDEEGDNGYISLRLYDHTFAIEGYDEDYEGDFELYVDGNLVPFSNNLSLDVSNSYIDFYYSDTDLLTAGESCDIQIKYTANPERPIKVWIPEAEDWEDYYDDGVWDEIPANAATLGSFDTGVKTVIVGEW